MLSGGDVRMSMIGPANVWFGIGFDATSMRDEPYAIIVTGSGIVSERKLAFHAAGDELDQQVAVLEDSVAGGIRTVVMERQAIGKSPAHLTFTGESINYIWAYGLQSNFGFHDRNFGRWASCVPIGECDLRWCNPELYFSSCAFELKDSCPSPWCQVGDASLALPAPSPLPSPMPASTTIGPVAPGPSPSRRCVPSGTGLYTDLAVWGPVCESQGQVDVCSTPICKWENALVQSHVRRHQFLGKALIQAWVKVERNDDQEH